jgi:hypothetical protein
MLSPLPEEDDVLELMYATGEATRPVGDLLDLPAPQPSDTPGPPLSEILDEMRGDRF